MENTLTVLPDDLPRQEVCLDNILPDGILRYVQTIPEEFLTMGEYELSKRRKPDKTDQRLRLAFWQEYHRVTARLASDPATTNIKMGLSNIYGGVCSYKFFHNYIVQDKQRLAFLLIPPVDYRLAMEEALSYGIERLREILELPVKIKACRCHYGCRCMTKAKETARKYRMKALTCLCVENCICPPKIDSRTADVIYKITELLDNRVKGAVVQRVLQKNFNINQDVPTKLPPGENMDNIDKRLEELERIAALPPGENQVIIDLPTQLVSIPNHEQSKQTGEGQPSTEKN